MIIYSFIYNFNRITQYNSTLTSVPSRGRNYYSLLRLKLISRSPLWLETKIVAFHPRGPSLIPDIILIYALFLIIIVISSITLISFILSIVYIQPMYILLRIDYDRYRSFHFGRAVLSTLFFGNTFEELISLVSAFSQKNKT